MTRRILLTIAVFLFIWSFSFAQSQNAFTTIILIRHAEKSTTPKDDPVLNDAGKARAEHLAQMLQNSGVQAIYSTPFQRTRSTVEPLAKQLSLTPIILDAKDSSQFAKAIREKNAGQVVVVVGHSNTIPEIIQALGGPAMDEIDETQYDNFFIVTMANDGKSSLLKLKY
ncbi:MAG TPA: phosphoglycerate mutase family protein [Acidobacteriota bacterium]|jgi:broad specificity phosphatase PhoE|nr:phosphoglycerate mutase family protein [Acidobacteriota bacterium]